MSLARLESQFQARVLDGTPGVEREIVGTARVPTEVRLAIYGDAYRARLTEALQNNYPMLVRLLGDRQFGDLAQLYIDQHPSMHFSVRWFGHELGSVLAATDPYRGQPVLAELASWEWNMALAFDAADASPLRAATLAKHPPETWAGLSFSLQPSVRLLSLATNAPLVWRALSHEETPPAGAREETPREWLLWRRGLDTLYRSLSATEARALHAARAGESFATICEAVASEIGEDDAPTESARLLAGWLEEELLSDARPS